MDNIKDLIPLIMFLVPGFLAAWIFYSLTPYLKPEPFERIIQALIFTLIVQLVSTLVKKLSFWIGEFYFLGVWDTTSDTLSSTLSAVVIGLIFSYYANNDKFHDKLREFGITKETSFPSEWHGTFSSSEGATYIVLQLNDGRRIMGWPTEWPANPREGYFKIEVPMWITDNDENIDLESLYCILINVQDVRWVEFMKKE
ncbi:DUF6338 family protein [Aeromonas veronii bv. sobria]|uniref:Holin n=1 Tax=Aeromonas veronii TaxID=654 RepID=A0ABY3MG33_AERVE|nr:DUF6338 family protein [Aeromonas veronii]RDU78347.1 hypothetical protein CGZ72_21525 [Aeromonas veronii]RDU78381.1 hypothetical protein CGZ76_21935 [Aeromonas veronii]TEY44403.1 hypothetical protein CIG14_21885 [Aeromonas veronii]TEY71401.1 hypothetical protein CIG16_21535 [Aeromonas veronii]TYD39992.1 hypothetical protein CJF23_21685 [Aeromonas veronii]